jgi:hypothetical protein
MSKGNGTLRTRAGVTLGGASLLLLVALTVATPAEALAPALDQVAREPASDRAGVVRQWSDALARVVRVLASGPACLPVAAGGVPSARVAPIAVCPAALPEGVCPIAGAPRQGRLDLPPPCA